MIRPNNPAIDVDKLRAKVRSKAEALRSSRILEKRRREPRSISARYHAAAAYLARAYQFTYPETRLPKKMRLLNWFGVRPAVLLLRAYNFALRPAREASAAQGEALRELLEAGRATSQRVAELELEIARLREALEQHKRSGP